MTDKIIFPEENDIIKTQEEIEYRVSRGYDSGEIIWVYDGSLEFDMMEGEKPLESNQVLTLKRFQTEDEIPVIYNGIQFETL